MSWKIQMDSVELGQSKTQTWLIYLLRLLAFSVFARLRCSDAAIQCNGALRSHRHRQASEGTKMSP